MSKRIVLSGKYQFRYSTLFPLAHQRSVSPPPLPVVRRLGLLEEAADMEGLLDLRMRPHTRSNPFTTPNSNPSKLFNLMGDWDSFDGLFLMEDTDTYTFTEPSTGLFFKPGNLPQVEALRDTSTRVKSVVVGPWEL